MVKKIKIGSVILLVAVIIFLVVTYERPTPPISVDLSTETTTEVGGNIYYEDEEDEDLGNLGDIVIGDIDMSQTQNKPGVGVENTQGNLPVEKISWSDGHITVENRMALTDEACRLYEKMLEKNTGDDITVEWRNPRGEEYEKFAEPVSWHLDKETKLVLNMHLTIKNVTKGTTEEVLKTIKLWHGENGNLVIEEQK